MFNTKLAQLTLLLITSFLFVSCAKKSDITTPVEKASGYSWENASKTSNLFLLQGVKSEFSSGDFVTFHTSKKKHKILRVGALIDSNSENFKGVVQFDNDIELKISPGSGNLQVIVIGNDGVGITIKKGMKVSVVDEGWEKVIHII